MSPEELVANGHIDVKESFRDQSERVVEFANQAEKLGQFNSRQENNATGSTQAIEAKFVTPLDPVIETVDRKRLPAVPEPEAAKLNYLRDQIEGRLPQEPPRSVVRRSLAGAEMSGGLRPPDSISSRQSDAPNAPLRAAIPPQRTHPLFPPLPMYGPPSTTRRLQSWFFRATSAVLSMCFLISLSIGALLDGIPKTFRYMRRRAMLRNPHKDRPFYEEEMKRRQERRAADRTWGEQQGGTRTPSGEKGGMGLPQDGEFVPTEGGPDPLVVDVGYYARRVGLDVEVFQVQTEDGFIIELWHVFNPREHQPATADARKAKQPNVFYTDADHPDYGRAQTGLPEDRKKYPVLMIHGLLQSAGAFCCNDDDSLAFYLAKSGYDVWLGNNRCGFRPKHTSLTYDDPRMWAWNIRQMGVMDLPALVSRVLAETGFPKLALIAHSQGTTETFVALAKEQRPELGARISVFCALAPAAYAGPLIGKIYFKFMRLVSPAIFRLVFGIHAFIPIMMRAHDWLPPRLFSWTAYHVFAFLFNWSDSRWERDLRDRMFQWAPVFVSAESMRWWLGRECFAKQRCILATREEGRLEDREDEEDDELIHRLYVDREPHVPERRKLQRNLSSFRGETAKLQLQQERERQLQQQQEKNKKNAKNGKKQPQQTVRPRRGTEARSEFAWYDGQFPPLALWVCGADDLVDGRRLLRRFDRGREPHVRVVHRKIIEGYEHLDVIWAMDAIEKVGKEVREVIWRTADASSQTRCRVPVGCDRPLEEDPDPTRDVPMLHSGGRGRMASISSGSGGSGILRAMEAEPTKVDASKDAWVDEEKREDEYGLGEDGFFNRTVSAVQHKQ